MAWVKIGTLRKLHPATWNEVWRIIKADAPDYAEGLRDPLLQELISHFDATEFDLRLEDIPERARALIPQHLITP